MKKIFLLLIYIISSSLFAHPASEVSAKYDVKTKFLTVTYAHQVRNADKHFIYEVTVKKGKKKIINQSISKQESAKGGTFIYKIIDLKKEDKIEVMTKCNKSGNKGTKITIE